MTPTMDSLLVNLERRIGDLAAVITHTDDEDDDENQTARATTELHRIQDLLDGVLGPA